MPLTYPAQVCHSVRIPSHDGARAPASQHSLPHPVPRPVHRVLRTAARPTSAAEGVRVRPTPHRRTTATGALVVTAAVLAVGVPGAPAIARGDGGEGTARPVAAKPDRGALPAQLTPTQRESLIRTAEKATDKTADRLDLGAQEKLVVRDVVKDARRHHAHPLRAHLRRPARSSAATSSSTPPRTASPRASPRRPSTSSRSRTPTPTVTPAAAEKQALARRQGARAPRRPRPTSAPARWSGRRRARRSSRTRPSSAASSTTARPNELHVVTDAKTGAKLYEWQAVETGTGNTQYSGRSPSAPRSPGRTYNLTDAARGSHKTYNLNRGTSGTGTLFSGPDDVWGNGLPANLETAGADAALRRRRSPGTTTRTCTAATASATTASAPYCRVHYGNNYVNAFWQDSCFCMTYGDGVGQRQAAHLDRRGRARDDARPDLGHRATSTTAVSPAA